MISEFNNITITNGWGGEVRGRGSTVAQWLRWCAKNRKVAGSIPAGVIGILH